MATLTALPDSIAAGTTVKYTRSLADYPANAAWVLTLHIAGAAVLHKAATASGADHAITLTAAETATLTPAGSYRWSEWVAKAGETFEVASGTVQVAANMASVAAGDLRTMAEKMLEAVNAVIAGKITDDAEQFQIGGRSITLMSRLDLLELQRRLQWDVARQKGAGRGGRTRRVTFTGTRSES